MTPGGADVPGADLVDVVVGDAVAATRVVEAIDERPLAATALALLLRGADRRSVPDGLVAESATYSLLQFAPEHVGWLDRRGPPRRRRDDDGPRVRLRRDGDILHVTLDRPAVRNAYDAAMRDELLDALAVVQADPALHAVLDGAGPAFCSGGDLDEFGTRPDPATAHLVRLGRSAGRALHLVADRVTARVHGPSVGSGVELAAFAGRVEAPAERDVRPARGGDGPGAGGRWHGEHRGPHRAPPHGLAGADRRADRRRDGAGLGARRRDRRMRRRRRRGSPVRRAPPSIAGSDHDMSVRFRAMGGIVRLASTVAAVAVVAATVGCADDDGDGATEAIDECDWPTWGRTPERTFSYACDTAIAPDTVGDLRQDWFFATDDAVTATPAVVDGTVYVGDWSGRFYAIDLDSGELDWSFTAEPHARVYAGQIVGSATVADVRGTRTVYVPSGETLYALGADDGACGGSATSAGPRATTTPPRSRARPRSSTAS